MFQATKTSFLGHMLQIVFLMMTVSHVEAYSYFLLASSCGCFPPVLRQLVVIMKTHTLGRLSQFLAIVGPYLVFIPTCYFILFLDCFTVGFPSLETKCLPQCLQFLKWLLVLNRNLINIYVMSKVLNIDYEVFFVYKK